MIFALGFKYGLRGYNGDNTYSWNEDKNIAETLHDGSNDTIMISQLTGI